MQVSQSDIVKLLAEMGLDRAAEWPAETLQEKINSPGGVARFLDSERPIVDQRSAALYQDLIAAQGAGQTVGVEGSPPVPVLTPDANGKPKSAKKVKAKPIKAAGGKVKPAPNGKPSGKGKVKPASKPTTKRVRAPLSSVPRVVKKTVKTFSAPKEKANPQPKAKPVKVVGEKVKTKPAPNGKPKSVGKEKAKAKSKPSTAWNPYGTWDALKGHYKENPQSLSKRGVVIQVILDELLAAGKQKRPTTKEEILGVLKLKFPEKDEWKMLNTIHNSLPGRLTWKYGVDVQKKKLESGRTGYWVNGLKKPKAAK